MTPETIIYFGKNIGNTGKEIQLDEKSYYKWVVDNWKVK